MSKKTKDPDLDAGTITGGDKVGVPGKVTRTKPVSKESPTGDDYVDHGAVCDDKEGGDCFLNGRQRGRLIGQLQQRVAEASTNYKIAAQALRVDELVKEEDELPLAAFILLDLVTLHSVIAVSHSLTHLKGGSLKELEEIAGDAKKAGTHHDAAWYEHAKYALNAINDEHLKDNIENAIDGVKERARRTLQKTANHGDSGKKAESTTYLDLLTDQAAVGYSTIRERVPATSSDGELITLWQAFAVENHTVSQYKQALTEKLDRYHKSGVTQIKKLTDNSKTADYPGKDKFEDKGGYVVWNTYLSGHPKTLVYEHAGRSYTAREQIEENKPAGRQDGEPGVYVGDGFHPDQVIVVPSEFVEVAIQRHEQTWGMPVATVMIDDSDPFYYGPARAKSARDNKAKQKPTITTGAGKIQLGSGPTTPTPIQPFNAPGQDE